MGYSFDFSYKEIICECDNCGKTQKMTSEFSPNFRKKILKKNNWLLKEIDDELYEFCCEKCWQSFEDKNRSLENVDVSNVEEK